MATHQAQRHRRILVTGGAGYLGSVLVPALLDLDYQVSVVDRCFFGRDPLAPVLDHPQLRFYEEDIAHPDVLPRLLDDVDAVVHLASISNDPTCDLDPNLTIETNYLATQSLAQLAQDHGVRQFVFASSCSVYGASGSRQLDEESQTGPVTLYALTKLASERDLLDLSSAGFGVTSLRFATLFGLSPRMRFDLAVNTMTRRGLMGQPIFINGSGSQYRPFVHVRDVSDAIILVLQAKSERVRGRVFNVGGNDLNYTIEELADTVAAAFPGLDVERRSAKDDARSYRVQFDRIRQTLGFVPRRTILDAVEEIREAVDLQQLGDLDDDNYSNLSVMNRIYGEAAVTPPHGSSVPTDSFTAKRVDVAR